jgi:hypothetical protein
MLIIYIKVNVLKAPVFRYAVIILIRMEKSIDLYFIVSVKYFLHEIDFRG